jgi:hypothetical protein
MPRIPDKTVVLGAAAAGGLVTPLFLGLIFGLGALKPEFSHLGSPMSLLGGEPGWRGPAFNGGIAVSGLLVIAFAIGLRLRLPKGWLPRAGSTLLVGGGVGLLGVGVFHCDPECRNVLVDPDWMGRAHILVALLAGTGCGVGPVFLWPALRRSPSWRDLAPLTLTMAVLANIAGLTFWVSLLAGHRLLAVEGLAERLGLVIVFLWMARMAARLGPMASRGAKPGTPSREPTP